MADLSSVTEIDLSPLPGKKYFDCEREWREEFIYFVMVDRFQDSKSRVPVSGENRSQGFASGDRFFGGTLKGVTKNLGYIAGLGCTAIWLSPVFEAQSYHGYDITNYLAIQPRFGTKQDLIDLVEAAHAHLKDGKPWPIRIILDVVINHSGDTWSYPDNQPYFYDNGEKFPFGDWRQSDRPMPVELRNAHLYHRRGQMRDADWDRYPNNQLGDMFGDKDYANDDDENGSTLINILIKVFCYWIREADVDGFRMDAIKHMNPLACSRFCSNIREYAYALGKRKFFLFGEAATAADDLYNTYLGPNTSIVVGEDTVFFGIDSVLDFRLAEGLDGDASLARILKGRGDPAGLRNRWLLQQNRALNHAELGRYLVTFVDNHDAFWQDGRFGHNASNNQVIGGVGYLLCALGTPCLYYGTEQGFSGSGGDVAMREGMFDPLSDVSLLNPQSRIYVEIANIAACAHSEPALRFGRMYFRQISGDARHFGLPFGSDYTLAFSRLLYSREVLVVYNVSAAARTDSVMVDIELHAPGTSMKYLYGGGGSVNVEAGESCVFVTVPLAPHAFAILT